jgi:hypothetical protein
MTNTTTPTATRTYGRRELPTKSDFVMPDRPADRSKNGKRAARKNTKRRIIL